MERRKLVSLFVVLKFSDSLATKKYFPTFNFDNNNRHNSQVLFKERDHFHLSENIIHNGRYSHHEYITE